MRSAYISKFATLSFSGDSRAAYENYLNSKTLFENYEIVDGPNRKIYRLAPCRLQSNGRDFWEMSPINRLRLGVATILHDLLSNETKIDCILVGRGRSKFISVPDPDYEFSQDLSMSAFIRYIVDLVPRHILDSNYTLNVIENSCTSGVAIFDMARRRIQAGVSKRALLISYDIISHATLLVLESLGAMSPSLESNFPQAFTASRNGFGRGEAFAAAIVSADESRFKVPGSSITNDGGGLTSMNPTGDGLKRSIETSLRLADLSAKDITLVKLHGTGTIMNDRVEASVVGQMFPDVPCITLKTQFGHALNASALFELGLACEIMAQRKLMPVMNSIPQDDQLKLKINHEQIKLAGRQRMLGIAIGFGGLNGSYIVESA